MEPMDWTPLEGEKNFWAPEKVGEEIVGEIVEITQGQYGTRYLIEKDNGDKIMLPSHKVLQSRLQGCVVGDVIKAKYTGELAPKVRGDKPTKMYECQKGTPKKPTEEKVA